MKSVVITGATSGIGFAVLRALASHQYTLLAAGRTAEHCAEANRRLKQSFPQADIVFFSGDLMQQSEVNDVADQMIRYLDEHCGGALDILINNAGGVRSHYSTTREGYEQQFSLNHLSGFLLTCRLMPCLRKGQGKVLFTGSESHRHTDVRWDDIMFSRRRYSCLQAYKQSKLCNLLFAGELNRRYENAGIKAYVVDPGLVNTDIGNKQTNGVVDRFWSLRKRFGDSADFAAQTYVYLCGQSPKGLYFRRTRALSPSRQAGDSVDAERLFELSERLCGVKFAGG